MPGNVDALALRRGMGRELWLPPQRHGPDGWYLLSADRRSTVIVTCADNPDDGLEWVHASIAHADTMPTYDELVRLHHAVWGSKGWAYQCFAPDGDHVNIHAHALHLWGLRTGQPALPNFGKHGTI